MEVLVQDVLRVVALVSVQVYQAAAAHCGWRQILQGVGLEHQARLFAYLYDFAIG